MNPPIIAPNIEISCMLYKKLALPRSLMLSYIFAYKKRSYARKICRPVFLFLSGKGIMMLIDGSIHL